MVKNEITLNEPSDEQKKINKLVSQKYNVIADCVAGSGKTTTILHIAKNMKNKRILLITYNAKLKIETREKKEALGLDNLTIHSYHSFCVKHYSELCFTDEGIIKFFKQKNSKKNIGKYDIFIVDESQDVTPLYYLLISKIISDIANKKLQIIILGDRNQSIYDYNKADSRFIVLADSLYQSTSSWKRCKLSVNFRTTKQIADFVNVCALRENRLKALKDGKKVKYVICNVYEQQFIFNEIQECLKKYNREDIFIIAPSVKSESSPARKCANYLSFNGIDIYVPNSDEEKIDAELTKGKITFSTFHQVKGLERKVILLFGFDMSYFTFYNKVLNQNVCPNTIYVALTRAIEYMIIFHHCEYDYLPFVDVKMLKTYANIVEKDQISAKPFIDKSTTIAVTKLTQHLSSDVLYKCREMIKYKLIQKKDKFIKIDHKVKSSNKHFEAVSDITGTAIPAYYEFITTGKMTISDKLTTGHVEQFIKIFPDYSYAKYFTLPDEMKIEDLLKFANMYCCFRSQYIYKAIQIKKYDWLSKENLYKTVNRVKKHISTIAKYEKSVQYNCNKYSKIIVGQLDCYDKNIIWEFKCVKQLSCEHYIQLAVYAFLHRTHYKRQLDGMLQFLKNFGEAKNGIESIKEFIEINYKIDKIIKKVNSKYYLMNILSNEIYELQYDKSLMEKMMNLLFYTKFSNENKNTSDEKFIKDMLKSSERFRKD